VLLWNLFNIDCLVLILHWLNLLAFTPSFFLLALAFVVDDCAFLVGQLARLRFIRVLMQSIAKFGIFVLSGWVHTSHVIHHAISFPVAPFGTSNRRNVIWLVSLDMLRAFERKISTDYFWYLFRNQTYGRVIEFTRLSPHEVFLFTWISQTITVTDEDSSVMSRAATPDALSSTHEISACAVHHIGLHEGMVF